jgi:hypothetical protein
MEIVSQTGVFPPIEDCGVLERRSHKRFELREGAIASLYPTVIGEALNISPSGLAFRYVASGHLSKESCILTISTTDRTFTLGMIPVEVVWDVAVPERFTADAMSLRSCGVKFRHLEDFQEVALRYFIDNYVTGTIGQSGN